MLGKSSSRAALALGVEIIPWNWRGNWTPAFSRFQVSQSALVGCDPYRHRFGPQIGDSPLDYREGIDV